MNPEASRPRGPVTDYTSALALAVIDGRLLYFEAFPTQARLRITMRAPGANRPVPLGSVIRLDTDEPGLRVCAPLEVEWATGHMEQIVAESTQTWASITRHCDG